MMYWLLGLPWPWAHCSDVSRPVTVLEISQYLENYLWPNYGPSLENNKAHILSIVLMVNEKYREKVSPWEVGVVYRP